MSPQQKARLGLALRWRSMPASYQGVISHQGEPRDYGRFDN